MGFERLSGTLDVSERFFQPLTAWSKLCFETSIWRVKETKLEFACEKDLKILTDLLAFAKTPRTMQQPGREDAIQRLWPKLSPVLIRLVRSSNYMFVSELCRYLRVRPGAKNVAQLLHYCAKEARRAFRHGDPRLTVFEILEQLSHQELDKEELQQRTHICMFDALEGYLGAEHLAIPGLAGTFRLTKRASSRQPRLSSK